MSMLRWLSGYEGVPYLARPTFRHEQSALIAASVGLAVAMGGFPQILAKKGFGATDFMLAALVASAPAGSLVAAMLSGPMRRWRQSSFAAGCLFAAAAMTAAIALLPLDPAYAMVFVALVAGVTTMVMTYIQARSAIWKANYPDSLRGNIISRNFLVQTILAATLAQSLGAALDWRGELFRWMFLTGSVSFVVGGLFMRRIRVRKEASRLKRDASRRPKFNPLAVLSVFGRDRQFALYMTYQMILGSATLAVMPILPKLLKETFNASYALSNLVMAAPLVAQFMVIPLLGGFFDRVSVFRFRSYGAGFWGVARLMLAIGVGLMQMPMVVASAFVMGLAQGFGRLAWNIGHMAFADPEDTHLYMGAHMMLAGLRGLTMPFLGIWLYNNVLGIHIIWISGAIQLVTAAAYMITDPHRPTTVEAVGPTGPYVP